MNSVGPARIFLNSIERGFDRQSHHLIDTWEKIKEKLHEVYQSLTFTSPSSTRDPLPALVEHRGHCHLRGEGRHGPRHLKVMPTIVSACRIREHFFKKVFFVCELAATLLSDVPHRLSALVQATSVQRC